jgi:hypothetical protein
MFPTMERFFSKPLMLFVLGILLIASEHVVDGIIPFMLARIGTILVVWAVIMVLMQAVKRRRERDDQGQ